jgi:DNA transformation protein
LLRDDLELWLVRAPAGLRVPTGAREAGSQSFILRTMGISAEYLNYVLEQLSDLHGVTHRRMFGGAGLYCDGVIFGLIAGDVLYFKVGPATREHYTARGMAAFRPYRNKPQISMSYYELPADVLEDPEQCAAWARRSLSRSDATR